MKAIVSCHHYPDDERIYYKQVQSLAKRGDHILYFTRSDSNLDLTDEYINIIFFISLVLIPILI